MCGGNKMGKESVSPKIRSAVKDVVGVYVHHIRDKIAENDIDYIKMGIDADIDTYEDVFNRVMSVWLLDRKHKLPQRIVDETIEVMEKCVEDKNHIYFIKKFPNVVYKTSKVVLKETKEGVLGINVKH